MIVRFFILTEVASGQMNYIYFYKMAELNAFNLNDTHKDNLTKYISFIKQKEKKIINEIGFYVEDFRDSK